MVYPEFLLDAVASMYGNSRFMRLKQRYKKIINEFYMTDPQNVEMFKYLDSERAEIHDQLLDLLPLPQEVKAMYRNTLGEIFCTR